MLKKLTVPRIIMKIMLAVGILWLVAGAIQDTQAAYVEPRQDDTHTWQHYEEDPWAEWRQGGPGPQLPPDDDFWTDPNEPSNVARWVRDSFPTDERGNRIYPDYFAGMYFDINNNGNLVLLRVSSATGPMPTFTNFPDVTVRDVEFSYNELRAMSDFATANLSTNPEYFYNSSGWGLDIRGNRIIVYLIEYSDEAISDFRSRNELFGSNSNMFVFKQKDPIVVLPGPPGPPRPPGPPAIPGGSVSEPGIPPPGQPPWEPPPFDPCPFDLDDLTDPRHPDNPNNNYTWRDTWRYDPEIGHWFWPRDCIPPNGVPPLPPSFSDDFIVNYSRAMETLNRLEEHFQSDEIGRSIFPDYIGGIYINDDGNLIVLRVSSATGSMPTFTNFPELTVRDVEFSYNELNAMMDFMNANIPFDPEGNINSWGLDTRGNRIIVGLLEYSDEAIADFRSKNEAFESNMFSFEQRGSTWAQPGPLPPGIPPDQPPFDPRPPGIPGGSAPGSEISPSVPAPPPEPELPPSFAPNQPPPPPSGELPPPPTNSPGENLPLAPLPPQLPPGNPGSGQLGAPEDLPMLPVQPGVPQEPAPPAANPPNGVPQEPAPPAEEQHPEEGGGHWNRRQWRNWRGRRWRNRPVHQQPVEEQQINQPNQWRNRPARRWRNHPGWNWNNPGNDNATEQEQHNAFGN